MTERVGKRPLRPDLDNATGQPSRDPDWQQWLLLVVDTAFSFARLLQAEAALAVSSLPRLLILGVLRVPMLLMTWLGFAVLLGVAVYTFTGSPLAGVGAAFLLQLLTTLVIELMFRRACLLTSLPESRSNAQLLAGIIEAKLKVRGADNGGNNQ